MTTPETKAYWQEYWKLKRREERLEQGMRPVIPPLEESVAALHPELLEEWDLSNEWTLDRVRPGSMRELLWLCPAGHSWRTRVQHRVAGHGCPVHKPRMSDEEWLEHRRASFARWYYSEDGQTHYSRVRARRLEEVVERYGSSCYLCLEPVELERAHLDHVMPRCAGGANTIENLRVTHALCNLQKAHHVWLGPVWSGYLRK